MTNLELVLNILAEASTTEISKEKESETFEENKAVARQGELVANAAKNQLEETTGKKLLPVKMQMRLKGSDKRHKINPLSYDRIMGLKLISTSII